MLDSIFKTILDMTLSSSFLIVAVLIARIILRKSPKRDEDKLRGTTLIFAGASVFEPYMPKILDFTHVITFTLQYVSITSSKKNLNHTNLSILGSAKFNTNNFFL